MAYFGCASCRAGLGFISPAGMITDAPSSSSSLALNGVGQIASPTTSIINTAGTVAGLLTNPIGSILAGLNPLLSVFGLNSSDPVKDQQRINRINDTFRAAMAGQRTPEGVDGVACLRDMAQGVSSGPNDPRACAVGSQVAAAYAKKIWTEYQARAAAGPIGIDLIGASTIPTTVMGAVTSPLGLVLLAGGAFLLLRKRGRR